MSNWCCMLDCFDLPGPGWLKISIKSAVCPKADKHQNITCENRTCCPDELQKERLKTSTWCKADSRAWDSATNSQDTFTCSRETKRLQQTDWEMKPWGTLQCQLWKTKRISHLSVLFSVSSKTTWNLLDLKLFRKLNKETEIKSVFCLRASAVSPSVHWFNTNFKSRNDTANW